ncbi:MAG: 4-hydroxy-3-methylbut-2-en-1-yl diphosphate synthase [Clostridia bacterium]|nr:4-hydroxy-3-methylbut-2-en-1-yl diphosphate synthase [Clostridia bacterium]
MSRLRDKLTAGETAIGTHIMTNDNSMTEMIGMLGYDYFWIDTEHTSISLQQVEQHLMACRITGVSSMVRVPFNDPVRIKPILEMGPDAVITPMIRSYDEAKRFVEACLYPPRGIRSYGPRYAQLYGMMPLNEYLAAEDERIMRLIQIEHVDAVRDLERILTIPGIDAFVIGPCDLSASLGLLGDQGNPKVAETIDYIVKTVHAAGKKAGVSVGLLSREQLQVWKDRGVDMISCANEADFVINGAKNLLRDMKAVMLGEE